MKDIILINLPTNAWYKKEFSKNNAMPPLGLMYIAIAYSIPIFFGTLIGAFFVPVNLSLTVANTYTVRTAYFP